jgi:hypothetical protein
METERSMAMDLHTARSFFMWCTIMNGGLLLLSSLVLVCPGDLVYRIHRRWFPLSREAFATAIYCFIGFMKVLFLMFNLVPYIALVIIG